jgi:hypothetical protein
MRTRTRSVTRRRRTWGLALDVIGLGVTLGADAYAIIGRPRTPMSYAGVARRTVRRY